MNQADELKQKLMKQEVEQVENFDAEVTDIPNQMGSMEQRQGEQKEEETGRKMSMEQIASVSPLPNQTATFSRQDLGSYPMR
jgi:hypothetical protein